MQYLKTEINLEKHNFAKKTVSTYITNELRSSNTQCLESMNEANRGSELKELFRTRTSDRYILQVYILIRSILETRVNAFVLFFKIL